MQIGFLGLGNMGLNLAMNMQEHGHQVIGWNRSEDKRNQARSAGLEVKDDIAGLVGTLNESPKVIWSMVSAGPAVDSVFFDPGNLFDSLQAGDIVIDGVNSHYKQTKERAVKFAEKGILLLDCGVSGGIKGAREGACIMVGGPRAAYDQVQPLIESICMKDGFGYFGESGAGHYVKMVHNSIEYGMMQAIAEGMNLLGKSEYKPDPRLLTQVWGNGSIIAGNLMNSANEAFAKDPNLQETKPEIGSLGTGDWAVAEALKAGVSFTSIANAVFTRFQSREPDSDLYKIIQAMRAEFGGHTSEERNQGNERS